MKPSCEEYSKMSKEASPNSPSIKNVALAFLVGGAICTIGQIFTNMYLAFGADLKSARNATSITLVFLGALLTALHIYDNIAKHAGAGSLVPITGFSNSVVAPAIEFKSEGHIMGIGAKMFIISGPVLVFGITASVVYGTILYVLKMFGWS